MATIPAGQKFHTVSAHVDTTNKGSAQANSDREVFTMQDIEDSVGGGSVTSLTTTGSSGSAATLIVGVLNIPTPVIPFTSLTTTGSGLSTLVSGVLNIPSPSVGTGTGGTLSVWSGSGSSTTLTDGPIKKGVGNDSVIIGATGSMTADGEASIAIGSANASTGSVSVALGYSTTASGNYSTAMGESSTASGLGSTALGKSTQATSSYSFAAGNTTQATSQGSTAFGWFTEATSPFSTAMGSGSVASGSWSTAMGRNTTADGSYSTAMGRDTNATGDYSTAMGQDTTASGNISIAIGKDNTSATLGSITIGEGLTSQAYKETIMGTFASDAATTPTPGSWVVTDRLFTIGNGDTDASKSTAFSILKNGITVLPALQSSSSFANDTTAAAGGVPIGGLYRDNNNVKIRMT